MAELPELYFTRYSPNGKASRNALPADLRAMLQQIDDQLSEDPDRFPLRTIQLADTVYLYKHPAPEIQITFKIDRARRTLEYLHVVAPLTEVNKPVFISYSHKDEQWLVEFKRFLVPLEKKELIKIWDDKQIQAGAVWHEEIEEALSSAKAAILLVSQNFLTSEFITEKELPYLLDAAKNKGLTILWIALSASTVDYTDLKDYQAVHKDPPLDTLDEALRNQTYLQIFERIKEVAEA